jgi:AbrB family looped-hinge helix DNA binding protein
MTTVTVSTRFQIVIPREVRDALRLQPGARLAMFRSGNRLEIIPIRAAREMRGFLRGIDTEIERDPDRV